MPQILSGRAYKVIIEESEKKDYDLIVMATRGLTHLSSYLIGSTAERVVRLSRQPVLTIPVSAQGTDKLTIRALSDGPLAGRQRGVVVCTLHRAAVQGGAVHPVHLGTRKAGEHGSRCMARMPDLKELHPQADEVKVEFIMDRDVEPSNSIVRFADDREIGIIVMSTHGRKGLRRVYIGNNTAEVVRKANRPVLTISHPFHKRIFTHPLTEQRFGPDASAT